MTLHFDALRRTYSGTYWLQSGYWKSGALQCNRCKNPKREASRNGEFLPRSVADGKTHGTPTWIWSVVVDGALYVCAYNGQNSRWYRAAMRQRAGRITAAGMTKDVAFETVEGEINDRIDDGYRAKYKGSPYLDPMIAKRACSATVRVTPRKLKPQ